MFLLSKMLMTKFMIINFSTISSIFSHFVKDTSGENDYEDELQKLAYFLIKTNKILWNLEDSARLLELGDKHVAEAKENIDVNNQQRNNLIREIDTFLYKLLSITPSLPDKFYSESPGMIIDRLSIIYIKLSVVQKIISIIKEDDLKSEYLDNEKILSGQIKNIGNFLDMYIDKLVKKEVYFEIQQPVKIYNDTRVRKYIKYLNN